MRASHLEAAVGLAATSWKWEPAFNSDGKDFVLSFGPKSKPRYVGNRPRLFVRQERNPEKGGRGLLG